jgi:hypothetical protein
MMNRIRVIVLVAVLTVGGLGLAGSSALAQVRSGTAPTPAPAARYYYGPGYNGYGYYYYPAAPTAPTYRGGFYTAPAPNFSGGTSTRRSVPDYTGRHDGLARPWLRPLQ